MTGHRLAVSNSIGKYAIRMRAAFSVCFICDIANCSPIRTGFEDFNTGVLHPSDCTIHNYVETDLKQWFSKPNNSRFSA